MFGGLVVSNLFLWLNLWKLKNEHFEFKRVMFELLKELCKKPSEDSSSESAE